MLAVMMFLSASLFSQPATQELSEIISQAKQSWQGINTLATSTTRNYSFVNDNPSEETLASIRYDFWFKDGKFLTKQRNTNASGKDLFVTSFAWNGKVNQMFDEQALVLKSQRVPFSDGVPYAGPMIFSETCDFLRPRDQPLPSLEDVGKDDYWADFAAHARIVGSDDLSGRPTVVVEYSSEKTVYVGRPYRAIVHFSEQESFYPVKYSLIVESTEGTWTLRDFEVKQLKRIDGGAGADYFVPIESLLVVQGEAKSLPVTEKITVDPESIAINQPIDDSVFTIPEVQARAFIDYDDRSRDWNLTSIDRTMTREAVDAPEASTSSVVPQAPEQSGSEETSDVLAKTGAKQWAYYALIPVPLLLLVALALRFRSLKKQEAP
jgi:hypothetical protein